MTGSNNLAIRQLEQIKNIEKKKVTYYFYKDTLDKLQAYAKKRKTSMNFLVEKIIAEKLEEDEPFSGHSS